LEERIFNNATCPDFKFKLFGLDCWDVSWVLKWYIHMFDINIFARIRHYVAYIQWFFNYEEMKEFLINWNFLEAFLS
jgi:hypothetical protein